MSALPSVDRARVLVFQAPGVTPDMPCLSCGLLHATLQAAEIPCDTFYGSLAALEWQKEDTGRTAEHLCGLVNWDRHDVVWLPVVEEQLRWAFPMVDRIRQRAPHVKLVLSGPSCADLAAEQRASVDVALWGDPEPVAPTVVRSLREGAGGSLRWEPALADLDQLPLPEYGSYFDQTQAGGRRILPVELGRGCRRGAEARPVCGCSRPAPFRTRRPERVIEELIALASRYHTLSFAVTDPHMDPEVQESVLPQLARVQMDQLYRFTLSGNLGATISRQQARLLRRAGFSRVRLQWRESGLTGPLVATLKWLREVGIEVEWSLPLGVVAEPSLYYLPPPERGDGGEDFAQWHQSFANNSLTYSAGPGFVRVSDRRDPNQGGTLITLVGLQAEIFLFCEEAQTPEALAAKFGSGVAEALHRFLESMIQRGLMARTADDQYITLPVQRKWEEVEMSV